MASLWSVVDDTDNRIEYSGDWSEGTLDTLRDEDVVVSSGKSLFTHKNTLHATSINSSSFTFRYNGTTPARVVGHHPNGINFTVQCFLDGQSGGPIDIHGFDVFSPDLMILNGQICEGGTTSQQSGEHELVFNIFNIARDFESISPTLDAFYLDYIIYQLPPNDTVDGDVLKLGDTWRINDPSTSSSQPQSENLAQVALSSGWQTIGQFVNTTTSGASINVTFNGTEISVFSGNTGSAFLSYQLDDEPPVGPGSGTSDTGIHFDIDQVLYNFSSLSPGQHTLVVKRNDSQSTTPSVLHHFFVTSQNSLSSSPNRLQGRVIGGIVAGVVGFFILSGLVLWIWRKRRLQRGRRFRDSFAPVLVHSAGYPISNSTSQLIVPPFTHAAGQDSAWSEGSHKQAHTSQHGSISDCQNELPPRYTAEA
ncbi:hypothetical protein D9758_006930 [Tetrapyrgos nigripes]|uniref:Uncharacterized protein n=1 Tax=Tetrapyrgos nigripes TaxID=182062 RepID=A0A8H5GSA2_9AGAR|nr:hypothetical protein D9758_006930 [Tetrapyrgos nigripes]